MSKQDEESVLGRKSNEPLDAVQFIEPEYLTQKYLKQLGDDAASSHRVRLVCHEFTSFCPVTGQPDFGKIIIEYEPNKRLIETKSLKLYLWKFRKVKAYNEEIIAQIAREIFVVIEPLHLKVEGEFNSRGGIDPNPKTTLYGT